MLPEVVFPTLQVESFEKEASERGLCENLDFLEERKAEEHLQTLACRKAIAKTLQPQVQPRHIKDGGLVLRKAEISDPTRARGKLASNLEHPYRIIDIVQDETHRLTIMDGKPLPRT
ncbi:hypothetical protein BHE74_00016745 [Ensete ventricosum]|nr:hypothetical protein GW17_00041221 [Ensete ventricosum]RWW75238.1 hypothetical protein BHE74_00016745 [Ensete ventricosum]RZS06004.1 hypothetical protein BHM03_00036590 [Ensete ventricosum]